MATVREGKDKFSTARLHFDIVDGRYKKGSATIAEWDRALTRLIKAQDLYIAALEKELVRVNNGKLL